MNPIVNNTDNYNSCPSCRVWTWIIGKTKLFHNHGFSGKAGVQKKARTNFTLEQIPNKYGLKVYFWPCALSHSNNGSHTMPCLHKYYHCQLQLHAYDMGQFQSYVFGLCVLYIALTIKINSEFSKHSSGDMQTNI